MDYGEGIIDNGLIGLQLRLDGIKFRWRAICTPTIAIGE